jgi:uncharacterized repeat protein (TIGR01451 family)
MSRVDANTLRVDSPISGTVYSGDFGDVLAAGAVITISGYVWDDNGASGGVLANGLRDGEEPGLAGAVVSLSSGMTQTTDAEGAFTLYAPSGEVITVTENNPAGYASTNARPGTGARKLDNDTLIVSALSSGSTSDGNLFGDVLASSVAIISGTVFDDAVENGVLEGGESGLPGVTVTLAFTSGHIIAVSTNSAGQYQFAVAPGAEVRITSTGPGGSFYPTTPESVIVRPPTAGVFTDNNFGYSDDVDVAVIYGKVFDDVNSSGEQDPEEPGLAGATITVTLNGGSPKTTTTSGAGLITGTFTFAVTEAGVYNVHETNPPGYRSTTKDDVKVEVTVGHRYYVEFGDTNNPRSASIYGTAFDDLNSNGRQDATEPGLAGVVISVTVSGGVLTRTTKSYGLYSYGFEIAEPGFHTVSEQDPALPGYRSTTRDEVNLYIEPGNSYTVDFGDTTNGFSNILGTVFNDIDGDGFQDRPIELGIADVPLSLSNGRTTTTDSYGGYTFPITDTGPIQVMETDPVGYHSTTPNTVTVIMTTTGRTFVVDFGDSDNVFASSFFGTVFDDQNANEAWDATEPGLRGVTVTLSGDPAPRFTDEWGRFTFLIEITGTYTVTETDPSGYLSTGAIPGDPAVTKVDNNTLRAVFTTLGSDLGNNLFGDVLASQVITISGYVWEDSGAGGGTAGDGVWDRPGEPGLAGAVVGLSSGMAQTTGPDGFFQLYAPPGEAITITETNPPVYVSTNAIPGNAAYKLDNDRLVVTNTLVGGQSSADNLFGDALPADLTVVKSGSPRPVAAGATLTYTLVLTNNGPSYAQGVFITDTLDAGVTFDTVISQPPSLSGPTQTGQLLTWYTPTLAAGASATIIFKARVDPDARGVIVNRVIITSNTPDNNIGNSDYSELTPISVSTLAVIYGTVFEDTNSNKVWDVGAGEEGIPDVLITLDGTITETTDPDGLYVFLTPVTGTHNVVETDPEGAGPRLPGGLWRRSGGVLYLPARWL